MFKFSNSASATLASSITSDATSLTVTTGLGALFPSLSSGQYFTAALVDSSNNVEFVLVTSRTGDVLTIVRGQEGSLPQAFSSGSRVELRLTSTALTNFAQLDAAQTFTGANTFSGVSNLNGGGNVAGSYSGAPVWTGDHSFIGDPTFTGTLTLAGINNITGDATFTGVTYINGTTNRATNLLIGQQEAFIYESATNAITLRTGASGNYKYATLASNGDLSTQGNITATGDVTAFSDERLKADWYFLAPDFVEKLSKVLSGSFTRTDIGKQQIGVGAQSLQAILPLAIHQENDGYLSVNYGAAAMVSCVELAKEVVALKAEIEKMKG